MGEKDATQQSSHRKDPPPRRKGTFKGKRGGAREASWNPRERSGGGQDPFKMKHSECAQEELLVATVENESCQNPRNRIVQMPEYEHFPLYIYYKT